MNDFCTHMMKAPVCFERLNFLIGFLMCSVFKKKTSSKSSDDLL